jgi:hypothetical protein
MGGLLRLLRRTGVTAGMNAKLEAASCAAIASRRSVLQRAITVAQDEQTPVSIHFPKVFFSIRKL